MLGESQETAEVEEVEDPPVSPPEPVWWDYEYKQWCTRFPPPEGFDEYERGEWGDRRYQRNCTDEEAALLEAVEDAATELDRAAASRDRDAFFAALSGPREEAGQVA